VNCTSNSTNGRSLEIDPLKDMVLLLRALNFQLNVSELAFF